MERTLRGTSGMSSSNCLNKWKTAFVVLFLGHYMCHEFLNDGAHDVGFVTLELFKKRMRGEIHNSQQLSVSFWNVAGAVFESTVP